MFDSNLPEDTRSATFSFNVVWHADRSWLKIVAIEGEAGENRFRVVMRTSTGRLIRTFPHEIDGDLAD